MQISLREAYEISAKTIGKGWKVTISVAYDPKTVSYNPSGLMWTIEAQQVEGDHKYAREYDEIFSIALGKLFATTSNADAKPVDDVTVNDKAPVAVEEEATISEIPF